MTDVVSFRARSSQAIDRSPRLAAHSRAIRVFTDPADPALWEMWNRLEMDGRCTVFQSGAFLRPLLERVGRVTQSEVHVLLVSDAIGPLLGLPFVRRRKGSILVLETADFGLCDYCAPLLANRFDASDVALWQDIWREIVRHLPPADILRIEKTPARIGEQPNPMIRMRDARPMERTTRQVAVEPAWLRSSVAKEAASRRRRLEREGETSFEVVRDPSDIDDLMTLMRTMRRRRFEARGILDSLEGPGVFEFYCGLMRDGCRDGSAVLGVLRFSGQPVAMSAALVHRGRFNGILTAMDDAKARYSPGLVSMAGLFDWCFQQKIAVYDLGLGEQHYKSRFGGQQTMLFEITQAHTPKGHIWKMGHYARTFLKNTITSYPTLASRIQTMRGK